MLHYHSAIMFNIALIQYKHRKIETADVDGRPIVPFKRERETEVERERISWKMIRALQSSLSSSF